MANKKILQPYVLDAKSHSQETTRVDIVMEECFENRPYALIEFFVVIKESLAGSRMACLAVRTSLRNTPQSLIM
jgi:hypothetical protein